MDFLSCRTRCILHDIWMWYPGVGWFIAILGALGVGVTILRDLTKIGRREKAIWIIVTFGLLLLELRSISLDRAAHDREQSEARREQLAEFDRIARGIDTTIDTSDKQFGATTEHMETIMKSTAKVAELSRDSIDSVTGGNGFCYMIFTLQTFPTSANPVVVHQGKHPLYDVDVRVVDLEKLENKFPKGKLPASLQDAMADDIRFRVGDLSSNAAFFSAALVIPFSEPIRQDFRVFFNARNGYWTEDLSVRLIDGKVRQALKVVPAYEKHPKVLFQRIDKEFPLVNGSVDWRP